MITLTGQHDKQQQSQKAPLTKHKQHNEEKGLKPVQNQQKSLHNQWKSSFIGQHCLPAWEIFLFIKPYCTLRLFSCYRLHHWQGILSEFRREVLSPQP